MREKSSQKGTSSLRAEPPRSGGSGRGRHTGRAAGRAVGSSSTAGAPPSAPDFRCRETQNFAHHPKFAAFVRLFVVTANLTGFNHDGTALFQVLGDDFRRAPKSEHPRTSPFLGFPRLGFPLPIDGQTNFNNGVPLGVYFNRVRSDCPSRGFVVIGHKNWRLTPSRAWVQATG